jgi:beta-lactam-binding protein with PASTA domain
MRTIDMPVIRSGEARPPAAEQVQSLLTPEAVQITLTYPELPGNAQKLVVEAGGHGNLPALVRNQSGIVDNYEIRINGMPQEWWNTTPPSVYLVPFGAPSGTYEEEVTIHFNPPRSAQAEAKVWELEVVAVSLAHGEVAGTVKAWVEITPYEELESELRPEIVTGRRRGEYALMVRNRANAPIDALVAAVDDQNALNFEFAEKQFVADPGRRAGTTFTARAKRHHWIGRPIDRRFEISARGVGGTNPASTRPITGTFRQKPWLPYWVPIVVPALIAAAALAWTLIPHKTTVPNLRRLTVAAAQIRLQKAHLTLSSDTPAQLPNRHIAWPRIIKQFPTAGSHVKNKTVVTVTIAEPLVPNLHGLTQSQAKDKLGGHGLALSSQPPKTRIVQDQNAFGKVIGQTPGPGRPARTGTQVSIIVGTASGLRKVPNVVGMTLAHADTTIREAGLAIVLPTLLPGQDPLKVTVQSQLPLAGQTVKATEAISVFLTPPPKPPPPPKPTTPTITRPSVGPTVAGLSAAAAMAAVAKAGAKTTIVQQFDVAKPGTVIGQIPPQGTPIKPGQTVELVVSAGYPEIVYSDGKHILTMNGGTGKGQQVIAKGSGVEDEPTWQPKGSLIAFRRGPDQDHGAIWMVDTSKGASSGHRMTAGPDDRRPAFSPDGKVIAFIRRTPTSSGGVDGDLCFVRTTSTLHQGSCIKDPAFNVDRPAWSPDGRAILVVVTDPTDQNQTELGEYTSATPFSSSPVDWQWQGLITDKMHGKKPGEGVLYAAFAPDGKQVAIVANWGATDLSLFRIFTAGWSNGQLGIPKGVTPSIRACEVAWRSDSGELAVTAADDCSSGVGALVRVKLSDPGTVTTLRAAGAQNPDWQFVQLR